MNTQLVGGIGLTPKSRQEYSLDYPKRNNMTYISDLLGGGYTSGYSGFSGTNGTSGYSGSNGSNGTSGYSGTNGAEGASGYSGVSGTNGASGYSGVGTSGYSGATGPQGTSGYSGAAPTSITNGTSNVAVASNSNVTIGVSGVSNVAVFSSTGANITNVNLLKFGETVIAGGNTGAATLTPNASAGSIFTYTLTGNITLSAMANVATGTSATIILTQDATGNRLLTSTMKFAGNSKTLSTTANSVDIMSVFYSGSTYYATLSKGYL